MWTVEFDERARKELRKLDPATQDRILKWLRHRIADQPDPRRFGKALKGRMRGLWRYRVGSWRIVCQLQDDRQVVLIVRIGHRRTVYRDLRALQEAGVPIGSETGEGYFIVRGYHLPPVMFDREEAAALLAGERLMQRWNSTELGRSYVSALDKIRAFLQNAIVDRMVPPAGGGEPDRSDGALRRRDRR